MLIWRFLAWRRELKTSRVHRRRQESRSGFMMPRALEEQKRVTLFFLYSLKRFMSKLLPRFQTLWLNFSLRRAAASWGKLKSEGGRGRKLFLFCCWGGGRRVARRREVQRRSSSSSLSLNIFFKKNGSSFHPRCLIEDFNFEESSTAGGCVAPHALKEFSPESRANGFRRFCCYRSAREQRARHYIRLQPNGTNACNEFQCVMLTKMP